MKVLITGGSGFIGRRLTTVLLEKGHHVTAVGYRAHKDLTRHDDFRYIKADTRETGEWLAAIEEMDAVVNLAGQTIFKRWSRRYKKQIYDSRILTTRHITQVLGKNKNLVFCSASAVGYYGDRGDDVLKETDSPGSDFLAWVGRDWEQEALAAEQKGIRVVTPRFGIVLGKYGGALSKMIPAFKSFAGGPIGSGRQWFPWIHMDDLVAGILFVIETGTVTGPVNFCAPNPVRNGELAAVLGKALKRPALLPVPAMMLKLGLGELGDTLLASQRVVPDKLTQQGFVFNHPDIREAITDLVNS